MMLNIFWYMLPIRDRNTHMLHFLRNVQKIVKNLKKNIIFLGGSVFLKIKQIFGVVKETDLETSLFLGHTTWPNW